MEKGSEVVIKFIAFFFAPVKVFFKDIFPLNSAEIVTKKFILMQ